MVLPASTMGPRYVPGATSTVSPLAARSMASWTEAAWAGTWMTRPTAGDSTVTVVVAGAAPPGEGQPGRRVGRARIRGHPLERHAGAQRGAVGPARAGRGGVVGDGDQDGVLDRLATGVGHRQRHHVGPVVPVPVRQAAVGPGGAVSE